MRLIIAFIVITLTPLAFAGDGQIDIASLPYTITEPGSYVVVANLTLTDLDTDGITIAADDVTVDLNGHTLTGPGKTAGSSGDGIYAASGNDNIAILNGTIRNFRQDGIDLDGDISRVWQITAHNNGGDGINTRAASTVHDNIVSFNGNDGIRVQSCSVVRNNISYDNGHAGIIAGSSSVTGNTACDNYSDGIRGFSGSTVTGNASYDNGQFGIQGEDSLISDNASLGNFSSNYNLSSCTSGTNH